MRDNGRPSGTGAGVHGDDVLVQAAAWRVTLAEAGVDSSLALETWLAASPAHAEAWSQVNTPWEIVGDHASTPALMKVRRDALHRARRQGRPSTRSGTVLRWAVAATVVLALGVGVQQWHAYRGEVYRTALGERRVIPLDDGSRMSLDSDSEVHLRFTREARKLELKRGQARFDVAHDARRPFAVRARDQVVVATGTAFNVDLLGTQVLVTLIEGRVEVLRDAPGAMPAPTIADTSQREPVAAATARVTMRAGEQLVLEPSHVPQLDSIDLDRATAWERGQLVFSDERLSVVATRVGRYHEGAIVVDPEVAALRISGVFKTGDVDTFVDMVTRYLPVVAMPGEQGGIVLRARG